MDDVTALRDALLEALPSRYFHREDMDNLDVLAALDTLIASAEQRGRDQWLHATAHGTRQWEGLLAKYDLAEDADASSVIAAVETRAALTPERLAKAVMEVDGQTDEYLTRFPAVREANLEYATAILAALATDETER